MRREQFSRHWFLSCVVFMIMVMVTALKQKRHVSCDHLSTTTLNDRESSEVDWIGSTGGRTVYPRTWTFRTVLNGNIEVRAREKGSLSKEVAFLEKLKQEWLYPRSWPSTFILYSLRNALWVASSLRTNRKGTAVQRLRFNYYVTPQDFSLRKWGSFFPFWETAHLPLP